MEITGRIHSFETFGTVDGPGIRFVIFMQGCPLHCIYCHNRDTWDIHGGEEYSVEEVISKLSKYLNYIRYSGGGVTVTGGEPTLQVDFVAELFKRCRKLGVHTALDTSGYADIEKTAELLKYTDLVLLDIKQIIDAKHQRITGVSNEKIHRFAQFLSDKGIPLWIRYVLIPGYTDDRHDLKITREFINTLKGVEKVEILPYHKFGRYKWDEMGAEYQLGGVPEPSEKSIEEAKKILY